MSAIAIPSNLADFLDAVRKSETETLDSSGLLSIPRKITDTEFLVPLEHTILHGLTAGEANAGFLVKTLKKKASQYALAETSPKNLSHKERTERKQIIDKIFNAAYKIGQDFSHLEYLRDEKGKIQQIPQSRGEIFIRTMIDSILGMPESQRTMYASDIWRCYALPTPLRLFKI